MGKNHKYRNDEIEADRIRHMESIKAASRAIKEKVDKEKADESRWIMWLPRPYEEFWIRNRNTWVNKFKSKNPEKAALSLVRHCFAKYQVPKFLENAWIEDRRIRDTISSSKEDDFKLWHICVAQGGSLYKKYGKNRGLSRMDVHYFLTCPHSDSKIVPAIWYGIARGFGGDTKIATAIWRSKLSRKSYYDPFWKSVAQWFVNNPTTTNQIDDLLDYISFRREQDGENFSMKGRKLDALLINMKDWHYDMQRMKSIGGGSWEGMPVHDSDIPMGPEEDQQVWHFRQIKTGTDLAAEGNKMHHCVAWYKGQCMNGSTAIWSAAMTYKNKRKDYLTIEVAITQRSYQIRQVRGFANRMPNNYEREMVKRWAKMEGLDASSYW